MVAVAIAPTALHKEGFMTRISRSALILITLLGLLWALPAASEPKEWDQAAVTSLAAQLAQQAGDIRQAVRRVPESGMNVSTRRTRWQVLDDLRVMENTVRNFARRLTGGAGREETYPMFQRIQTLRRDIAEHSRRVNLVEPVTSKLETARELLAQIEPYYEAEAAAAAAAGE